MDAEEGPKAKLQNDSTAPFTTIHPHSPRPTYPTTPCQDKLLSPFDLFSEEKIGLLRVNSPALPLEELARILADHWDCLSDEAKTPYKNRATEEGHRQEALGAAVVLTQIGTPSFRPGSSTPVALGNTARRCLEISSPDWQESLSSSMATFMDGSSTCTNSPGADVGGIEHTCGGDATRDAPVITPVTPNTPVGGVPLPGSDEFELHLTKANADTSRATSGKDITTKKKRKRSASTAGGEKRSKSAHKKAVKAGRDVVAKMSKKDPNRPKRNQSSYMIFYTEQRDGYKRGKPSITTMDLGRAMGEAWRSLSAAEKEPYTLLADADRKRYENDLCAIIAQNAAAAATRNS